LNPILGIERKTSKLILYNPGSATEGGGGNGASLELDKSIFISDTMIRRDLRDSGVAICSQNISAQFSDNFDFQFRDDVIREIILNEEILGLHIHVDVLPDSVAAFTVRDYEGLIRANRLILQRWLTPLLPGRA
uniref:Translation initiation factor eIF-2B subunit epsilon (inferred by orthology to a human protein) n=1 Tax=Anisakis simplex TaxID=6269 RepID=A0A0M3JC80_ANISI